MPITTQWEESGHIYPVQVCQYGLSHLSRWITNSKEEEKYETISLYNLKNWNFKKSKVQIGSNKELIFNTENGTLNCFSDKILLLINLILRKYSDAD